jgi:hypothetical protein
MAASLAVFALFAFADFRLATAVGILASGVGGIHTLRRLLVMLPKENLPALLRPWRETLARLARV